MATTATRLADVRSTLARELDGKYWNFDVVLPGAHVLGNVLSRDPTATLEKLLGAETCDEGLHRERHARGTLSKSSLRPRPPALLLDDEIFEDLIDWLKRVEGSV